MRLRFLQKFGSVVEWCFSRTVVRRSAPAAIVVSFTAAMASAGPYPPAAGQPGSDAIAASDPGIVEWANSVTNLTRGPENIANLALGLASFGTASAAVGPADNNVVSLGDGGSITVSFAEPITNGPGADFAVYENGFASGGLSYLELGFVEVSSDGTNFFRFPSVSLTPTTTQTGSFGLTDPTNLYDLAGKYVALQGTPFDLAELAGISPLLNVNDVRVCARGRRGRLDRPGVCDVRFRGAHDQRSLADAVRFKRVRLRRRKRTARRARASDARAIYDRRIASRPVQDATLRVMDHVPSMLRAAAPKKYGTRVLRLRNAHDRWSDPGARSRRGRALRVSLS